MSFRQLTTASVLVSAAGLSLLLGGTAYAFWSTSGTGAGTATAGTARDLVVGTASVAGLFPGATNVVGGTVSVQNPNPFPVALGARTFGATTTTTSGCDPVVVTYASSGGPTSIAAGATVQLPLTASMTTAAANACQGASFTAPLTVTAQSS